MTAPVIDARERSAFALRLAALFGALFMIYGFSMPYLPVWLDWQGLSTGEIAIVAATPAFVRLFLTPTIAFLMQAMVQGAWGASVRASMSSTAWL